MPKTETPIRIADVLDIPRGRKTEIQRRLEALTQAILDSDEPFANFEDVEFAMSRAANLFHAIVESRG